jgi:Flp pilus assembly protein TadG
VEVGVKLRLSSEAGGSVRTNVRGTRSRECGQSLAEISILLPLLLIIVMVIVVGGDMFNAYLTVINAGRDGARVASQGGSDAEIRATVASDAERLRGAFDSATGVAITTDDVQDSVRVQVCYDHPHIIEMPFITAILDNPAHMCSATEMPLSPFSQ